MGTFDLTTNNKVMGAVIDSKKHEVPGNITFFCISELWVPKHRH